MKKILNAKNIVAAVAILMAIVGGAIYGLNAPKADADNTQKTEVSAQQKIEKEAISNQVKKYPMKKRFTLVNLLFTLANQPQITASLVVP